MQHRQYPRVGTRAVENARSSSRWVATEKIHGANLVVATDGERVRVGKRKAWLAADEPFFGWQRLRVELEAGARAVHRLLGESGVLRVYGEFFGGAYPHPEVSPAVGVSAIQTGVWYAPDLRFAVFDMLLEPVGDPVGVMLAHRQVEELARAAGLALVPCLGRGSRAELERLPVRFASRMPARLGLPTLADNLAEGYVLKTDVQCPPARRATIKHKIAEFDERRFDGSEAFSPDQWLSVDQLTAIGLGLVNPPRIASARSKLGPETTTALIEEVVLDVLVDLETVYPAAYAQLGAAEDQLREAIGAQVSALCAQRP